MNFNQDIITGKVCPYCGRRSEYVDSSVVYGRSYGIIYYCKPCDAFVGVHHKTSIKALGRLANKELREAKKQAHFFFDQMWKNDIDQGRSKHEARNSAYYWLAEKLGIDEKYCHIGMFDVELCNEVVQLCKPYSKNKK